MKVFIDCGANLGQGLLEFEKKYKFINNKDWEIYSFEPNPDIELNYNAVNNIKTYQKAVWVRDEKLKFARAPREFGYTPPKEMGGNGVVGEMTNVGCRIKNETIENVDGGGKILSDFVDIEAIDFSNFIKQFEHYDKVVVKMDIEGAEYDVLRHLIKEKTASIIDDLFVETHERFVKNEDYVSTVSLLQDLKKEGITKIEKWV